jgi:hypothetical protein
MRSPCVRRYRANSVAMFLFSPLCFQIWVSCDVRVWLGGVAHCGCELVVVVGGGGSGVGWGNDCAGGRANGRASGRARHWAEGMQLCLCSATWRGTATCSQGFVRSPAKIPALSSGPAVASSGLFRVLLGASGNTSSRSYPRACRMPCMLKWTIDSMFLFGPLDFAHEAQAPTGLRRGGC